MKVETSMRRWLIKVFAMILALLGVIWAMNSLRSPTANVGDPSNPVGALLGAQAVTTTTLPKDVPLEDKVIRARVKKDL